MRSLNIQRELEREIIGQPRAIDTLVRAATLGHSGLCGNDAPAGMFLMLGPSGTGKTHIACSLAHVLHGDTDRLSVVDCVQMSNEDEWQQLSAQIARRCRTPVR